MRLATHWILVVLICLLALGWAFFSDILIISSGFILDDIGYTETQRQTAERKASALSLFGFVSLCFSILIMFLSGWIARLILKMVGSINVL